ncbi:hypothetical protein JZ751_016180 [Albula glossodonta]|uniref:Uncharacterized protein n=1 Tax=Albula glossodonta TaxID=121402 RepID=A0A8T2N6B5_9TELE|nr:hypothetical protein JZ751_016180 [Albula glossodonta]
MLTHSEEAAKNVFPANSHQALRHDAELEDQSRARVSDCGTRVERGAGSVRSQNVRVTIGPTHLDGDTIFEKHSLAERFPSPSC